MKRLSSVLGFALTVLVAQPQPADAQPVTLYCATGSNGVAGTLYTVNPATAAATPVGPILVSGDQAVSITGLAVQPGAGVLYGITANRGPSNQRSLITIDPLNGNATLIGSFGNPIGDITFDASGTLYGWQKNSGGGVRGSLGRISLGAPSDTLVTLNLSTGAATPIGNPGIFGSQGSGLAFVLGTLYLSADGVDSALRTVNPATGLTTVGPTLATPDEVTAINSMTASPAGVLYAVATDQSSSPTFAELVTIDTSTGVMTTIGSLPGDTDGLAFVNSAVGGGGGALLDVPALGAFGLLALGAVLALAGLFLVRFR